MKTKWSETELSALVDQVKERCGTDLAERTYSSRLLGSDRELVLHGGGNTSVKSTVTDVFGDDVPVIYVKASGSDLSTVEPEGHCGLNLTRLMRLKELPELSDDEMFNELLINRFDAEAATPSLEALMHVFIEQKFIDHTHADAILVLTNRPDGEEKVREALGDDVTIIDYVLPGFALAKAAAAAYQSSPNAKGMVLLKHGLVTWGETAKEAYEATIELVTRAEQFLSQVKTAPAIPALGTSVETATQRYSAVAPLLRGMLAVPTDDPDRPNHRVILRPLINNEVLALVDWEKGKQLALTPPLTADHLIRTKALPMWVDRASFDDPDQLRQDLAESIAAYRQEYDAYFERHHDRMQPWLKRFDSFPRVIMLPGLGAICVGANAQQADIVKDITRQTVQAKLQLGSPTFYEGLSEDHIFDMEYRAIQHAKLGLDNQPPLEGTVALVTGAAGAIGAGICQGLLDTGCHVVVTDLDGDHLHSLVEKWKPIYGERVVGVPLDVTDPKSVSEGFDTVIQKWGGIDLVIPNAGVAFVSPLATMEPSDFQRLERINIEGTLYILSEAARHFELQGTGGDIVLVSTKNVFAPGATFGAYSATKAASHQLARIASLELAAIGVRVNMVSPDAVFSHGQRRSGLWAEVGPGRMRARNLDEKGLEEYYQNRNLLKAKVTAEHVANAVLYFATRQSPTTGATIPVDGGLPDSTPR